MDKLIRVLTAIDWLVGILSLVIGVYFKNPYFLAGGVLSLIVAYTSPTKRMYAWMQKKIRPKADKKLAATLQAVQAEAMYEQPAPTAPVRSFKQGFAGYKGTFIRQTRHNKLQVEHLVLSTEKPHPAHYC